MNKSDEWGKNDHPEMEVFPHFLYMSMDQSVQHLYNPRPDIGGILYAWFPAMHTRVDVLLHGRQGEAGLLHVMEAVHSEVVRLERLGNYYDPHSELARLNRTASACPQVVNDELFEMLSFCIGCYERTGGCFDVTVSSDNYVPGLIKTVCLSPERRTLFFRCPGTSVDLSGFLKGYALEKIRGILLRDGIENVLVNMGNSSVLALGHSPASEDGWNVGFNNDFSSSKEKENAKGVWLKNECLTTSGNNTSARTHIISPFTGTFVEGKRGVAVVTSSGAVGEVVSTALFVADVEQRKRIEKEFSPRLILDI